jgi:hypothetical protein
MFGPLRLTPGNFTLQKLCTFEKFFIHHTHTHTHTYTFQLLQTNKNRFGVAAVTYRAGSGLEERDSMGETTTTMMGCRCTDNAGLPPIKIQCALALRTAGTVARAASSQPSESEQDESSSFLRSAASANVFDVIFQQRSTADYMTCKMTQISVQSVRWPVTRFSGRYV